MKGEVKAACLQLNVRFGDPEGNLAVVKESLYRLAEEGVRLAVLPEMWSCGFSYRALKKLAQSTPRLVEDLASLSQQCSLTVVGSLPEPHGEQVFNTAYLLDRGRLAGSYRKMHLFSLMGEDRHFQAGDECLVADTAVGRIGVMICYDLRFPELARRLTLEGAEIIAVPAQWPAARSYQWRTLIRARAIENQLFVLGANCCGTVGNLEFDGTSLIAGPRGEILAQGCGEEGPLVARLDLAELARFRREINCLRDRRPECY